MRSAAAKLELELAPGERLLWAGKPVGGIQFQSADIFLIPFSLLWLGFSIFWVVAGFRSLAETPEAPEFLFPLLGIPFILIGLYLVVGRFFLEARRRSRVFYGLTSKRAIIIDENRSRQVRSVDLREVTEVHQKEGRNGIGTIILQTNRAPTEQPRPGRPNRTPASWSFDAIPKVGDVYEMVQDARAAAPK